MDNYVMSDDLKNRLAALKAGLPSDDATVDADTKPQIAPLTDEAKNSVDRMRLKYGINHAPTPSYDDIAKKYPEVPKHEVSLASGLGQTFMTALPGAIVGLFGGKEAAGYTMAGAAKGGQEVAKEQMAEEKAQNDLIRTREKSIYDTIKTIETAPYIEQQKLLSGLTLLAAGGDLKAQAALLEWNKSKDLQQGKQQFEAGQAEKLQAFKASESEKERQNRLDIERSKEQAKKEAKSLSNYQPKEHELQSATYYNQMKNANENLESLYAKGFDPTTAKNSSAASSWLPEYFKPEDVKSNLQAEREFVTGILRKESGAAISKDEFENYAKRFFPRAGDGPEVLAQKARSRAQAVASMKAMAGRAVELMPSIPSVQKGTTTNSLITPEKIKKAMDRFGISEAEARKGLEEAARKRAK